MDKGLEKLRGITKHDYALCLHKKTNIVLWRLKTVPEWESPYKPMRTLTNGTVVNGSEESWLRRFSTLANALHVALSRTDHPTPSAPDYHSGGECSKHALVHPLIKGGGYRYVPPIATDSSYDKQYIPG